MLLKKYIYYIKIEKFIYILNILKIPKDLNFKLNV